MRGLSLAAIVVFGPGLVIWLRLTWQQHLLDRKLRQLQAVHDELAREHERLKSDPAYVEGLIRSTFKVAKPDELVIPRDALEADDNTH